MRGRVGLRSNVEPRAVLTIKPLTAWATADEILFVRVDGVTTPATDKLSTGDVGQKHKFMLGNAIRAAQIVGSHGCELLSS